MRNATIAASTPSMALTAVTPACMPIENDSTAVAVAASLSAKATITCCVPAPPGVSGTSVEAPQRTITTAAPGTLAGSPNPAIRR